MSYNYGVGKSWIYERYIQNGLGTYADGFESNQNAYDVFTRIGDSLEMAKSLSNLGNIYHFQGAYDLALPYYIQAAEMFEHQQQTAALMLVLGNIFSTFANLKSHDQQLVALRANIEGEQRERLRIAEDLHDDFGAGLSKIALLDDILANQDEHKADKLSAIAKASRQLQRKMGEIVWALNTNNDSLASLLSYLRHYGQDFFADTRIQYKMNSPEEIPELPLNREQRRGLFLVIKEALHNVLKHSKAENVLLDIEPAANHISILVKDDGQGFQQVEQSDWSNGLRNMQKRMKQLGGSFAINNKEGTHIMLEIPYSLAY